MNFVDTLIGGGLVLLTLMLTTATNLISYHRSKTEPSTFVTNYFREPECDQSNDIQECKIDECKIDREEQALVNLSEAQRLLTEDTQSAPTPDTLDRISDLVAAAYEDVKKG